MKRLGLILLLLATACGDSGDDGIASLEGEAAVTSTTAVDAQTALLDFAECVREQGVDIDDPTLDSAGNFGFVPSDVDPDELLAARDACSEFLADISIEAFGFDRTAIEDQLFAYAQCMRDNGFDMPDPDLDNTLRRILGQGDQNTEGISGIGPFGDIDFEDPNFSAADEACRPGVFADFDPPTP